jgi:acyl carrier protein
MTVAQVDAGNVMSFSEFGADSILGAELVANINARLHLELKTTAIFNYPGVKELARHIHESYVGHAEQSASRIPRTPLADTRGSEGVSEPRPSGSGIRELPQVSTSTTFDDVLRQLESGELTYDEAMARFPGELV